MTSLQLFAGHDRTWQAHFSAATNMFQTAYERSLQSVGFMEETRDILFNNLPLLVTQESAVVEEVVAFRFFSGSVIWLDIISSITTGKSPRTLAFHASIISPDFQVRLEDLMGCKNWVMLQIGLIAALSEHAIQNAIQGHAQCDEVGNAVQSIMKVVQAATSAQDFAETATNDPTTLITYLFAHMTNVYLHLVIHGFQELHVLEPSISTAMDLFRNRVPVHLRASLVAPLFMIACVAGQDNEQYFRDVFSEAPLRDPFFKHREKFLPSLEEIWTRRQALAQIRWSDCLIWTRDLVLI